jgi:hypothetical protein
VIGPAKFNLVMFKPKLDGRKSRFAGGRTARGGGNGIDSSFNFGAVANSGRGVAGLHNGERRRGSRGNSGCAGDDGVAGADGVNPGDSGLPGGDGESVAANAGSALPITAPLNKATATAGNGGIGGDGIPLDYSGATGGGNDGNGGAAATTATTTIITGRI